jgi:predicted heme/steroid binding protein
MKKKRRSLPKRDLKAFDGGEEKPIYIAYQGKVYDVSGSLHS